MRFKSLLKLGASLAMIGALAACGGDSSSSPTPTPTTTPPAPASVQSQISAAFATIFNTSANAEPVEPTEQSVPPVAPASEPIDF